MATTTAELNRLEELKATPPPAEPDAFEPDDDELRQDLLDAMGLLSQSMHLLNYLGDPELCKSVTKRERATMLAQAERLKAFLGEAEAFYDEDSE